MGNTHQKFDFCYFVRFATNIAKMHIVEERTQCKWDGQFQKAELLSPVHSHLYQNSKSLTMPNTKNITNRINITEFCIHSKLPFVMLNKSKHEQIEFGMQIS